MLSAPTRIPYAVLFGGDRYMLFTLYHIPETQLHGLLCSDIIHILDPTIPFMPLITYCLLRAGASPLCPRQPIQTPPVDATPLLGRTRQSTRLATANISDVPSSTSSVALRLTDVTEVSGERSESW
jgi:hypothetical protein